jgi:hypothetical protein
MRPIQRVISIGFATAAIAASSMPALSWTVWPDVDFEWYANVGRAASAPVAQDTSTSRSDPSVIPGQESASGRDLFGAPATHSQDRAVPTSQPEGRIAPSLPETELVSPTLPYSGSNRR